MPFQRKVDSKDVQTKALHFTNLKEDISSLEFYQHNLKEKGISEKEFFDIQFLIQEEERIKLGRELHDNVNSLLAMAKLYINCIQVETLKGKNARNEAVSIIMSAIQNIRIISAELVASQKRDATLLQLIKDLLIKIRILDIFEIKFKHSRNNDLIKICPQRRLMLFRILQEQLNNIIKHSKAKHVNIELTCRDKKAVLIIADDGVGFDASKISVGTGMTNIYARVSQFDGLMKIKSSDGNGCILKILLPLPD
ncbi:MAG: hypothetical protein QM768_17070 [Agriterribacter sp.]